MGQYYPTNKAESQWWESSQVTLILVKVTAATSLLVSLLPICFYSPHCVCDESMSGDVTPLLQTFR